MEEVYGPQIDWNRYHELIDIEGTRPFTDKEKREYGFYLLIVEALDKAELRDLPALDRLTRRHE
ncbi:MAG: hypothetical protein AABW71_04765 [Nanoarchaeota archaeon]